MPTAAPSTVTSAESAEAYGAIRWGAGISSQNTSGRRVASCNPDTAARKAGGSASDS